MNYFINVVGGTGLNIALASWISNHKKEGDKFYVMSPYFDIFEACEAVDGVYKPNEARDFIFDAKNDENSKLVMHRLYDMDGFIRKELNYETAWSYLIYGEKSPNEAGSMNTKSVLNPLKKFPNLQRNIDELKKVLKEKKFKDFILVNFTGGQSPLVQVPPTPDGKGPDWSKVQYNYENEPLKRHYPIEKAQEFAELYHKAHPETAIISFQLPNEPSVNGDYVIRGTIPYLAYYEFAKLPECKGAICIDSCLQHLIAGVTKEVVIWAHSAVDENNLPFGYSYNKNIIQKCRRDDILFFSMLGPSGSKVEYIEPEDLLKEVEEYL